MGVTLTLTTRPSQAGKISLAGAVSYPVHVHAQAGRQAGRQRRHLMMLLYSTLTHFPYRPG